MKFARKLLEVDANCHPKGPLSPPWDCGLILGTQKIEAKVGTTSVVIPHATETFIARISTKSSISVYSAQQNCDEKVVRVWHSSFLWMHAGAIFMQGGQPFQKKLAERCTP